MRANNNNEELQNEKRLGRPIQRFLDLKNLKKQKKSSSQEDVTGKSRAGNL